MKSANLLYLAPMEGVVDAPFRQILTAIGGIDQCVTEFLRVTDQRLPHKVFHRLCPELDHHSRTQAGTPVALQLLGGKPEWMAANGERAAYLGAHEVDINFGCPAKAVNNHDGGACLLQTPQRIFDIVNAVRREVPAHIPVTAKVRLGFGARTGYLDIARAVEDAGAARLVVHARSKVDGYKPPAYWHQVGEIQQCAAIPIVVNGDIFSVADYHKALSESGCRDVMIGRGLLRCPDLALQIKASITGEHYTPMDWPTVAGWVRSHFEMGKPLYPRKYLGNRLKQWLSHLRLNYAGAALMFEQVKRVNDEASLDAAFDQFTPGHVEHNQPAA